MRKDSDTKLSLTTTSNAGAVGRRQEQEENVWLARLPRFESVPNGVRSGDGDLRRVKEVSRRREVFTHRSDSSRVAKCGCEHWRGLSKETVSENVRQQNGRC